MCGPERILILHLSPVFHGFTQKKLHPACPLQITGNRAPEHGSKNQTHLNSMTTQFLKGEWSAIRTKLKDKYPDLTENDLAYVLGQEEEIFTRVQARTGLTRKEIEDSIQDVLEGQAA